jgi:hypothetical protein
MDETDDLPLVPERPRAELARADDAAPGGSVQRPHGEVCTERSKQMTSTRSWEQRGCLFPRRYLLSPESATRRLGLMMVLVAMRKANMGGGPCGYRSRRWGN